MKRFQIIFSVLIILFAASPFHAAPILAAQGDTCISDWFVVPSPTPPNGQVYLERAAGSAANNVWAVGYAAFNNDPEFHTLTQHWDGSQWTIFPSPHVSGYSYKLVDVTVLGDDNAWAVGYRSDINGAIDPLILHWNGSAWTMVEPTSALDNVGGLISVSGTAAGDVWAVGASAGKSVLVRWNGTALQNTPTPVDLDLIRVIAKASDEAWALGVDADHNATLLNWDGSAWSVATSFQLIYQPGTYPFQFETVTDFVVPSSNAIWIIGNEAYKGQWSPQRWFWNGSTWSSELDIQHGSSVEFLGIAGESADDLWTITKGQMTHSTTATHRNSSGEWENFDVSDLISYPVRASMTSVPGGDFWILGEDEQEQPFTTHGIFTCTQAPSGPVTPVSPAQDQIVTVLRPTFEWQEVADTKYYNLEIEPGIYSDAPHLIERIPGSPFTSGPSFTENGEYSWRVQACNYVGCSEWSKPVTWIQQPSRPSGAPELVSPPSGTIVNSHRMTLTWSPVFNTEYYRVRVKKGSPDGPLFRQANVPWTSYGRVKMPEDTYYWRVRACNPGGCSPWSETFNLTINVPVPEPPELLLPEPKSTVNTSRPYFEWTNMGHHVTYRLQLRHNSRRGALVSTVTTGTKADFHWTQDLPNGQYHWRVKACNYIDECSKWSKGSKFTVLN